MIFSQTWRIAAAPNAASSRRLPNLSQVARVGFALLILLTHGGCGPQELEDTMPDPTVVSDTTGSGDLKQGLDFLNRLEDFNAQQIQPKVLNHLQQWLDKQPDPESWQPDPIAQQLQDSFAEMTSPDRLASSQLEAYDLFVLQEATWFRDLSRVIANQLPLAAYLAEDFVSPSTSPDLRVAIKLFEWCSRNLHTVADVQPGSTDRMGSDLMLYAWEAVLMGRGTVPEKMRAFLLLARQLRIPVVVLALENPDSAPTPWLAAAFIEGQLYLFDMRLGTPVPGPGGQAVATWQQVQAEPELLDRLGDSENPYRVSAADLSRVVVLIDATPAYLSKRMKILEAALAGADKMVLSISPTPLAQEIAEATGIQRVGIWDLPYRVFGQRMQMTPQSPGYATLFAEHNLLEISPLKVARVLHFRGRLRETDPNLEVSEGYAADLYLESRTSTFQLQSLNAAPAEQMDAERRRQLESVLRRTTIDATYWLGMLAFDLGDYSNAIFWLEKQLKPTPENRWHDGARWTLGLAYETLGRRDNDAAALENAIEEYAKVSEGPLAAACRYRTRLVRQQQENALESIDQ